MKKILVASAIATLAIASQADAAANLTYAAVTGNTYTPQTVWSTGTGASTANYTLFLLQPVPAGSYLNTGSDGKGLNDPTAAGMNNFSIYGESFVPGQTAPSDSSYTLTLRFADGAQISGVYSLTANGGLGGFVSSASSTATAAGTTYTLNGFQWNRGGGDVVGPQSTGANGEGPDYSGLFSFSAAAVPEPSTWAMMLVGFGMVGAVTRRRKSAAKVTFA